MNEADFSEVFLQRGVELLGSMTAGQPLGPMMGISVQGQEVLYAAAYNAFKQAKYPEAMQAFSFLLLADHLDRRYHSGLAACLRMQKQHAQALKFYTAASMLDRTDPEPVIRMAECHLALGDLEQARAALNSGLAQARAHKVHRGHVPRFEAMLGFLANESAPAAKAKPAAQAELQSLQGEGA